MVDSFLTPLVLYLKFCWWDIPNRLKESLGIEPCDPIHGFSFQCIYGLPGPHTVDEFGFVQPIDRFS